MVWSAALFGATARVLRAVAGRRALHVVLLAGGVFTLGLLCGQRAQAAESVPSAVASAQAGPEAESATGSADGSAAGGAVSPATRGTGAVASAEPPAGHRAEDRTAALTDGLGDGTTPVTRGLRDRAQRVTDGLEWGSERIQDLLGGSLGGMPDDVDTMPSHSTLPGLPPFTHLPFLPLPLPAPVTDTPAPGGPADQAPAEGSEGRASSTGTSDGTGTARGSCPQAAPAPVIWRGTHGQRPAPDAHAAPPAPFQQPPGGEPDGMLGNRAATDQAGSRYGDAPALTPVHRAPLVLVPGAAARVDTAETRDRYRDIPVFPA